MNNRTITYNMGIGVSISQVGNGRQIQFFNVVLYAQFIYVSFAMVRTLLTVIYHRKILKEEAEPPTLISAYAENAGQVSFPI